jgi:uncharacterized lipoprotein YmbA
MRRMHSRHDISLYSGKPKIAPIENVTATQGMKVELKCVYDGDGEITAKWIFKGETLEAPSSTETVSQHVDKDEQAEDNYDEQYHATSNGMDEDNNNVVKKRRAAIRANRQADVRNTAGIIVQITRGLI